MALGYFFFFLFYCGCRHFLAKTTLYFDQKKCPEKDQWAKLRTLTVIQKLQRDSRYYSIRYLNQGLWLNHIADCTA